MWLSLLFRVRISGFKFTSGYEKFRYVLPEDEFERGLPNYAGTLVDLVFENKYDHQIVMTNSNKKNFEQVKTYDHIPGLSHQIFNTKYLTILC